MSRYHEQQATKPPNTGASSESSDLSDLGDIALEAETDKMDFLDDANPDDDTVYRLDLSVLSKLTELARLKEVDELDDDDLPFDVAPGPVQHEHEIPNEGNLQSDVNDINPSIEVSSHSALNGSKVADIERSGLDLIQLSNSVNDLAWHSHAATNTLHLLKRPNPNSESADSKRQKTIMNPDSNSTHIPLAETTPQISLLQAKLETMGLGPNNEITTIKEHTESHVDSADEAKAAHETDQSGLDTDVKPNLPIYKTPEPSNIIIKTPQLKLNESGTILGDSAITHDAEDDNDNGEEEDEDEDEDDQVGELVSRGLLRPEPHAEYSQQRKLAVRDLVELETEYSNLSDKLFHDHVKILERELQWCEDGTHPELVRMNRRMDVYFRELLALADHNLAYKLRCIDETTHATRTHIHQDFIKNLLDHKNQVMTETTSLWYEINHERTQFDRLVPDFSYTALPSIHEHSEDSPAAPSVVSTRRRRKDPRNGGGPAAADATLPELVLQRNRIDQQLGELNGLVDFYGFPAVVAGLLQETCEETDSLLELLLKRATPAEIDADLHAMKAVLT